MLSQRPQNCGCGNGDVTTVVVVFGAGCRGDPWTSSAAGFTDDDDEDASRTSSSSNLYATPSRGESHTPLLDDPALSEYRQRKTEALKQQDATLDTMHSSVKHLLAVSGEIDGQFDEHREVLNGLDDDVEVWKRLPVESHVSGCVFLMSLANVGLTEFCAFTSLWSHGRLHWKALTPKLARCRSCKPKTLAIPFYAVLSASW